MTQGLDGMEGGMNSKGDGRGIDKQQRIEDKGQQEQEQNQKLRASLVCQEPLSGQRFIGVDGGGTKTACLIGDGCGNILGVCYAESSSIKSRSWDQVKEVLGALIKRALELSCSSTSQLKGIFLGLAGADRPEDKQQFVTFLHEWLGGDIPVTVHNDAITAVAAGTWGEAGMVLISGTGSIAYGYLPESDTYVRVGGWGYLLGDEGSGFDIGKKALSAVMKQHDGRGRRTLLTELILDAWSLPEPDAIITHIYNRPNVRAVMADLSKLVVSAAKSGDKTAARIIDEALEELGKLAVTVKSRLSSEQPDADISELPLLLSGGMFSDDWFLNQFARKISVRTSGLVLNRVALPPVTGCYVLALKQAGIGITDAVKEKIQEWETGRAQK
jgi:N-acetylglucosamine kinase-like BadF-type ATPase